VFGGTTTSHVIALLSTFQCEEIVPYYESSCCRRQAMVCVPDRSSWDTAATVSWLNSSILRLRWHLYDDPLRRAPRVVERKSPC
jgi:hypothetical protein